jgi:hypothetical protein
MLPVEIRSAMSPLASAVSLVEWRLDGCAQSYGLEAARLSSKAPGVRSAFQGGR